MRGAAGPVPIHGKRIIVTEVVLAKCVHRVVATRRESGYKHQAMALADDFVVRKTQIGLGLFTRRAFRKGQFVIEYTGRLMPNAEADRKGGRYLFRVDERWTIDGTGHENMSRYINHSCKPNCIAYTEGKRVRIYAKKGISRGEELSYDYGKEYFDAFIKEKGCGCASCAAKARGAMVR
jgi:uncharacterized protein